MHEMVEQPVRRVAMLSTHGYFDPVPQLGRTDTGGQVVYVLELAKALSKQKEIEKREKGIIREFSLSR